MNFAELQITKRVLLNCLIANGSEKMREKTTYIRCKCPHCDDNKSKKAQGRGFFVHALVSGDWLFYYKCHNGGCDYNETSSIWKYLQRHHPDHHKILDKELQAIRGGKSTSPKNAEEWQRQELEYQKKIAEERRLEIKEDLKEMRHFVPITSPSSLRHKATKYCEDRLIPKSVYEKFLVCAEGKYKNRIIIPFYLDGKKPRFFQGRALYKYMSPKYLNRVADKEVYNLDFVDWSKPVLAFEGLIDSLCVENSIAFTGMTFQTKDLEAYDKTKLYLMLDNDAEGDKKSLELLQKGYKVFKWRPFLEKHNLPIDTKDFNDVVTETGKTDWCGDDFEGYFATTIFEEHFFKSRIKQKGKKK